MLEVLVMLEVLEVLFLMFSGGIERRQWHEMGKSKPAILWALPYYPIDSHSPNYKFQRYIYVNKTVGVCMRYACNCAYMCVSEGKKCSVFGKFAVLSFLIIFVFRFALLPYYR